MTELHPELAATVSGRMIRHKLLHALIPFKSDEGQAILHQHFNEVFEQKQVLLRQAVAKRDLNRYVFLHERPYRAEALSTGAMILFAPPHEVAEVAAEVWRDSENINECRLVWRHLLKQIAPFNQHFMSAEDAAVFSQLPDTVTIYRGFDHRNACEGFSWTLSREKADWFARRFAGMNKDRKPMVATATLSVHDLFAFVGGRGESEIIVRNPRWAAKHAKVEVIEHEATA